MEVKRKGNILLWIIIALLVGVIGLGGGYILFHKECGKCEECKKCEETQTTTDPTTKKIYTYKDIAGYYVTNFEYESAITGTKEKTKGSMTLWLYEDGTYSYRFYGAISGSGIIGNYIISDNKIIMNELFETGSSTSVSLTSGTRTLTIDENNSIIDKNAIYSNETNIKEVTLIKKEAENNTNEFKKYMNGLNEMINQ